MVETGQSGAYNLGTGEPHSVREVIDTVERVTGRRVPVDARAAPAGRSGRALCGARRRRGPSWAGRRDFPISSRLSAPRGPGIRSHPHGYGSGDDAPPARAALVDPLLSVVMPAYNERDTIEEIIRRVLAVPLRIELIVVDDASTDGTRDILQALAPSAGVQAAAAAAATAARARRSGGGSPRSPATSS